MQLDIERYIKAATNHGTDTGEGDHEVGDLQEYLRIAWGIMTVDQRRQFVGHESVQELFELGDY